ncbi:hypothetical protein COZ45_03370 [Candidatus Uhrbacteria bacterium CG_4_10_14_3_um_filter_41_21]|nr:MAG: hypothetical protein COZ45_03370 [Candidatus Uhrbacteria bacterium CG_4_10_14_3_um_filter_41_21]
MSLLGNPVFEAKDDGTSTEYEWIHVDHLGSVAVTTDSSGAWTTALDYYPFGEERVNASTGTELDNRYSFTNKERDEESDLMYFEARYLSTDSGRFLSKDSWGGDYSDPQSLNKYAYARNNPISLYDPSGNSFFSVLQKIDNTANAVANVISLGGWGVAKTMMGSANQKMVNEGVSVSTVANTAGSIIVGTAAAAGGAFMTGVAIGEAALATGIVTYDTQRSAQIIAEEEASVSGAVSRLNSKGSSALQPTQDWINSDTAKYYSDILKNGGRVDPIETLNNNGTNYILDGHHRYIGGEMAGVDVPTVQMGQGGLRGTTWDQIDVK